MIPSDTAFWVSVYQDAFPILSDDETRQKIAQCVLDIFVSRYMDELYIKKSNKTAEQIVNELRDTYLSEESLLRSSYLVPAAIGRIKEALVRRAIPAANVDEYASTVLFPRWRQTLKQLREKEQTQSLQDRAIAVAFLGLIVIVPVGIITMMAWGM